MIDQGNKFIGGLSKVLQFYGIIGFIQFTKFPYMILITKRSPVGLLGGHYIYHIDETLMLSLAPKKSYIGGSTESKLLNTFKQVDLSKNFYFSYSYDLSHSLQFNLLQNKQYNILNSNKRFIWNHNLLKCLNENENETLIDFNNANWILPIIHGFVDQSKLLVYGRVIYVTLIARRSRHFAGARYLKRGANEYGDVANEIESEQIVSETLTTPFISKFGYKGKPNPNYTSFLQYRGSVPIFWTQDSQMGIKPMINIGPVDPFFRVAACHFKNLFNRYGSPIFNLNLVKCKERLPREIKLSRNYNECIQYLNQFLEDDDKLRYTAWDMSRASKSNQDVIGFLENFANECLKYNKFFHSKMNNEQGYQLQSGIVRTNCVDCLDRTNAAQFVIGKVAFGYQLNALGVISDVNLMHDTDAVNMLTEMYHDHGDTIALQYGGSALVNRVESYRKIGQWSSHSRDLLENIKRYYSNSILDGDKQAAIDLFLGNNDHPPTFNNEIPIPNKEFFKFDKKVNDNESIIENYHIQHDIWLNYYRPRLFTSIERHFSTNMNSTLKYLPRNLKSRKNISPFYSAKLNSIPSVKPFAPVKRWMSFQSIPSSRVNSSIGTISENESMENENEIIEEDDCQSSIDVNEMIRERLELIGANKLDLLNVLKSNLNANVDDDQQNIYYEYMNENKYNINIVNNNGNEHDFNIQDYNDYIKFTNGNDNEDYYKNYLKDL